jgi:hypothetical protein
MSGVDIVLSDRHGAYMPQIFAESLQDAKSWEGYDPKDLEILLRGPNVDGYWETWQNILDNACYVDQKGFRWQLHQDGDLFVYCWELMTREEKENLFNESFPQLAEEDKKEEDNETLELLRKLDAKLDLILARFDGGSI